jgi:uncharacterized protein YciI
VAKPLLFGVAFQHPEMVMNALILACLLPVFFSSGVNNAQVATPVVKDPVLAKKLGADENGMRQYVLVILKTGPKHVPEGPARDEMFAGHFANIKRLANAGKLVVAGPFGDKNDWRGLFIFAVDNKKEAENLVATDPVIRNGEMIAEYHLLYSSAALMTINDVHKQIAPE